MAESMEDTSNDDESFVSALQNKYGVDGAANEPLAIPIIFSKPTPTTEDPNGLFVPGILALTFNRISHAGPMLEICGVITNVTELDLSVNRLSRWGEIFKIISHLPKIHFLNLSSNPLKGEELEENVVSWQDLQYDNINELVLNSTKVSWKTVSHLLDIFPKLSTLHLSLNEYESIDLPVEKTYQNLTECFISENKLTSWNDICKVGKSFPNLRSLVVMNNPIVSISGEIPPEENFQSLKMLNITRSRIDSWTELENLKRFPTLTEVRLLNIPLLEEYGEKLRRCLIIAFLPNISQLNGSPVTELERCDSERAFIRHFMDDEEKPQRYDELIAKHGHLDPLAEVDLGAANTVNVTVHFGTKSVLKQFSVYLKIGELKKILSKKFVGQAPHKFNVFYHDVGSPYGHDLMSFLQRSLLSYRVKDGDELYIELKQK